MSSASVKQRVPFPKCLLTSQQKMGDTCLSGIGVYLLVGLPNVLLASQIEVPTIMGDILF